MCPIEFHEYLIRRLVLGVVFQGEGVDNRGEDSVKRDGGRVTENHSGDATYGVVAHVVRDVVFEESLQSDKDVAVVTSLVWLDEGVRGEILWSDFQ
jgi:hypothetical protein